ncbi:transcription factor ETV7 isoform X2 [Serinus canaria]|uniref:transcription factor ETV7 isoform X1 n=1 Tax=Serinus canaria TaxID=9135 RepID=UPI0021CCF438|nr:transcription factor ETV7 isoform X1 [Serinus canaria]XP_050841271.1 transcription factor ETV7 isoform X2 [Serinus canaria]
MNPAPGAAPGVSRDRSVLPEEEEKRGEPRGPGSRRFPGAGTGRAAGPREQEVPRCRYRASRGAPGAGGSPVPVPGEPRGPGSRRFPGAGTGLAAGPREQEVPRCRYWPERGEPLGPGSRRFPGAGTGRAAGPREQEVPRCRYRASRGAPAGRGEHGPAPGAAPGALRPPGAPARFDFVFRRDRGAGTGAERCGHRGSAGLRSHRAGHAGIQPSLWSKEDVIHWLRWAEREYSLRPSEQGRFEMNGKALCILTKDDFRHRAPSSGDVLYEIFQFIKTQRRALVCSPLLNSPFRKARSTEEGADCSAEAAPVVSSWLGCAEQPLFHSHTQPLILSHHSSESSCRPGAICSFPAPLSAPVDGKIADCRLLWEYVYQLLADRRYEPYIRWEDREAKVFRVVNPNGLAQLWGNHKNRMNMTYEKMSRALRHYYKLNIIKKEPGQKLLFRFLKTPGEAVHEKSSKLEQLENEDNEDLKEDPVEVSPQ